MVIVMRHEKEVIQIGWMYRRGHLQGSNGGIAALQDGEYPDEKSNDHINISGNGIINKPFLSWSDSDCSCSTSQVPHSMRIHPSIHPFIYHLSITFVSSIYHLSIIYVSINFHQGRIKRSACNTY